MYIDQETDCFYLLQSNLIVSTCLIVSCLKPHYRHLFAILGISYFQFEVEVPCMRGAHNPIESISVVRYRDKFLLA